MMEIFHQLTSGDSFFFSPPDDSRLKSWSFDDEFLLKNFAFLWAIIRNLDKTPFLVEPERIFE